MTTQTTDHAQQQAKAQLESIRELVAALNKAREEGEGDDEAHDNINNDALSVEVRSGWTTPGEALCPMEFSILLCTGGPAVRIIGELSEHNEPESARLQYQEWGTPWTDYPLTEDEEETVLAYCSCFYFGE